MELGLDPCTLLALLAVSSLSCFPVPALPQWLPFPLPEAKAHTAPPARSLHWEEFTLEPRPWLAASIAPASRRGLFPG